MDKDLVDWIEKAAIENFKAHSSATDALEKNATTTLTVLFAGIAGGLAYAAKAVESKSWSWLSCGAAGFTFYLAVLAALLILRCLWVRPYPQMHNEPKNLLGAVTEYTFDQIRKFELENMQTRIQQAGARNAMVARSLNRIRLAAIASPLAFIASAVAWVAMGA